VTLFSSSVANKNVALSVASDADTHILLVSHWNARVWLILHGIHMHVYCTP